MADGAVAVLARLRRLRVPPGLICGAVCPRCWEAVIPITPLLPDRRSVANVARAERPAMPPPSPPPLRWRAIGCTRALGRRPRAERDRRRRSRVTWRRACARPVRRPWRTQSRRPVRCRRERARGFNQARELARHLGRPVAAALARTRRTPSQADLPAARRHANVRGAFAWRQDVAVKGRTIVLVDDVSTTGATLNACARPLLDAGATEVRALTAARAVAKLP